MTSRTSLSGKVTKAISNPSRVLPHARRIVRNARLRAGAQDHTDFYAKVVGAVAATNPDLAIGSDSRDSWLEVGQKQLDYLLTHGLNTQSRVLDIGCGNMRAGWRIAQVVDPGNYYGCDITPEILVAAQRTIVKYGIQDRMPHLTPTRDVRFDFLPAGHFDIVTAHSVFSHTRFEVIEEALDNVPRLLAPGGFFDFTYFESPDAGCHAFADEDFYYPTERLIAATESRGLKAEVMDDWQPYIQAKLRIRAS